MVKYVACRSWYVMSYHTCQLTKPNFTTSIKGFQPVHWLYHTFYWTFGGPLPVSRTGNKYCFIAVEHLTRWSIVQATKSHTVAVAVWFFQWEALPKFGSSIVVFTKNGPECFSSARKHVLPYAGAKTMLFAWNSPQWDGRVQRMVQSEKCGQASDNTHQKICILSWWS